MIQRIQTIYFLIATIFVSIPLFGVKLFQLMHDEDVINVTAFGNEFTQKPEVDFKVYFAQMIVIALLLIWAIFSFKNRKRQITLSWFAFVLNISTAAYIGTMAYGDASSCTQCLKTSAVPSIGFYFFLAASIFILLGNRSVRKDKKLVDSLDRLR